MQSIISSIRQNPAQPKKGSPEAEILSKERLLECFKIIMDHEVIKVEDQVNQKAPLTEEELLVANAKNEDSIAEKTGVEMAQFFNSKQAQKLDKDPRFL